jgi:hypothetical protein
MTALICICGSMAFIDEMENLALSLTKLGYRSTTPAREERDLQWEKLSATEAKRRKKSFIDGYLSKIRTADALIIANYRKHEIEGYVGPNTLMEAAFGYSLGIPVVFLHDPAGQNCGPECLAIAAKCLNGDVAEMAGIVPA